MLSYLLLRLRGGCSSIVNGGCIESGLEYLKIILALYWLYTTPLYRQRMEIEPRGAMSLPGLNVCCHCQPLQDVPRCQFSDHPLLVVLVFLCPVFRCTLRSTPRVHSSIQNPIVIVMSHFPRRIKCFCPFPRPAVSRSSYAGRGFAIILSIREILSRDSCVF